MQRSRRLLFVLSPDFLAEKSFSLLECRLGLYIQHGHQASIVTITYRSVSKLPSVEVTQLRQAATTTVTWRGSRSEPRRSRFWLRLRLALPVRPLALGRRLIDSTSSQSDLAALALQRTQRIHSQKQGDRAGANQSHRNRQASTNQSYRHRQAAPIGRGKVKREGACRVAGSVDREEEPQHSRGCSGCTVGQMEDTGAELTVKIQQVSHYRTEIRSDLVLETDPTPIPDSSHNAHCTPSPAPVPDLAPEVDSILPNPAHIPDLAPDVSRNFTLSNSALPTCQKNGGKHKHQQMIGSR
ncbi:hypothetical protein PAMA_020046 [Pampus argenteus]